MIGPESAEKDEKKQVDVAAPVENKNDGDWNQIRADIWKCDITHVYFKKNPMKLPKLPSLFEKYKGKEVIF